MKIKLFLHIGTHKTGSTAIQQLLWSNRDNLAAQGILYPDLKMGTHAHHEFAWATGIGPQRPKNRPRIRSWTDQIFSLGADRVDSGSASKRRHTPIHTVVLSSEEFEFVQNTAELRHLAELFDARIVAYLRKQDHYLESSYNQQVRMYGIRFPGSIYQFAFTINPFARYNFRLLLQRWETIFGRENIIVRPYGTTGTGSDIRADFLHIIGASTAEMNFPEVEVERDNVSLHAAALPYLARINEVNLPPPVHRQVILALHEMIPRVANARLLQYEETTRFYQSFEKSNEWVFKRYLGSTADPFAELIRDEGNEQYIDHNDIDNDLLFRLLQQYQAAPSLVPLFRDTTD